MTIGVHAGSPWDGLWYLDKANSRFVDRLVTLEHLPKGMWRYTEGGSVAVFAPDGRPYPEANSPDFTMTARLGRNTLELVESAYGRDMQRDRWELAQGGRSLLITATRIYPDGRDVTSRSTATRVEGESGFPGKWKIAAENESSDTTPADERQKAASAMPRPYWVISTAADGVMSWFMPATGELIRGKPDGRSRPLTGPQQPAGRRFAWKQVSPNHIEFFASDRGHLVGRATETLSADGTMFTDTLWSPGHEDEKDIRVFRKQ
jgi:hypothetical protein